MTEEKDQVKEVDREETIDGEQPESAEETVDATAEETSELEKLQAEIDRQKDAFLRLNAEFQNFKKRTEKEKSDIYKFANEKVFLDLLEVMDNVERAMSALETEEENPFFGGIRQIKKSFQDIFNKYGLERIDAVGAPFDPELHHAVMTEDAEDTESEHVIEELQKGYTLNGKVIRHAMVKVAK